MNKKKSEKNQNSAVRTEKICGKNLRVKRLNNKTEKLIISAGTANYFDQTKRQWKSIDNSLTENLEGYESNCDNVKMQIKKGNCKSIKISKNDKSISWEFLGKQSSLTDQSETALTVEKSLKTKLQNVISKATYQNADENTDLQYVLQNNNLKENIIVKQKRLEYKYNFTLNVEGLIPKLQADKKGVEFYSESLNELEFIIPAPFMYDKNGELSDSVYYTLKQQKQGYKFSVVADKDWINASKRAFPVTIDPQIIIPSNNYVTKQVQYRARSSGTVNTNLWINTASENIKAGRDSVNEYRTLLSIKKSLIDMPSNRIIGAKLLLAPNGTFSASLTIGDTGYYCNSANGNLEVDLLNEFMQNNGNFEIIIEPAYGSDFIDANFAYSATTPVLEIEYLTNENTRPTKKSFTLAGIASGEVDLCSGEVISKIVGVPAENSVNGLEISHVYKKDFNTAQMGQNFHLNIQEKLTKCGTDLDATYVYVDSNGDFHGFKDYYYYIDYSGNKNYVTDKNLITVNNDGSLNYNSYVAYCEYRSATGLTALTHLNENLKFVTYVDQRADEIKQVESKLLTYGSFLKEFVILNKADGLVTNALKNSLENNSAFEYFMSLLDSQDKLLLTEAEAQGYKSLLLQKEALQNQYESLGLQEQGLDYSKITYNYQANLIADENDSLRQNYQNQADLVDDQKTNVQQTKSNVFQQISATSNQLSSYVNKKTFYLEQVKAYFVEYNNALSEQDQLNMHLPINFLTDGKIFKGFNKFGNLIAVYDAYENYIGIEYEVYDWSYNKPKYRISKAYDNLERVVYFSYTPNNKLSCIMDIIGKKTQYFYNGDKLSSIVYDSGEKLNISYLNNNISALSEEKNQVETALAYSAEKLTGIDNYSLVSKIAHNQTVEQKTLINSITLSYDDTENSATIVLDTTREKYYFNSDDNLCKYMLEEDGVVTKAEKYEFIPYWIGTAIQTNPRSETIKADKSKYYLSPIETFEFINGEQEETTFNQFNKPLKTTVSGVKVNATGTNMLTSVKDYVYNDNQQLIEEITTQTYSNPQKSIISHTKYNYNAFGEVIRKESYIEGEELLYGKTIQENVFDNKGNQIKTLTYNSLDTSSKFYTENEYDETGRQISEKNSTGEGKTKLSYLNDGSVVQKTMPNGGKIAYGYDWGNSTSISQSTEDGEENSTQKYYTCGMLTKVTSGNNEITYSVDYSQGYNNRKQSVCYNGTQDYIKIENKLLTIPKKYDVVTTTNAKNETETIRTDKRGKVIAKAYSNGISLGYTYNGKDKLTSCVEYLNDNAVRTFNYNYDELDRLVTFTEQIGDNDTISETYTYDDYGKISSVTQSNGVSTSYEYKDNANRDIEKIILGDISVKPQTDCLGRNKGKEIYFNNAKIMQEVVSYKKVGDHATVLPNTIWYGDNSCGSYQIKD